MPDCSGGGGARTRGKLGGHRPAGWGRLPRGTSRWHATGSNSVQLASDLPAKIEMMNPVYFLENKNPSRAKNWWIRTGTLDTSIAHTVVTNLAAITSNLGDTVNSSLYWDGGHAVNEDASESITWVSKLTGHAIA